MSGGTKVFKGLIHKTTYFKGQGRQEQEGKKMTLKTKGSKIIAKIV